MALEALGQIARRRTARRQPGAGVRGPCAAAELSAAAAKGEYNIWYGKRTGRGEGGRTPRAPAMARVNLALDTGRTAGDGNPAAYICIKFAKGCCGAGASCRFLHRPPLAADLAKLEPANDVFGRERHASNRTDMAGVGTWSREQSTLYVGKLAPSATENQVRAAFGEFGELKSVRVFASRGFAFVAYCHRGSAEFAYQAMMDQPLGAAPMINVRWADEDPNPRAKRRRAEQTEEAVQAAMARRDGLDAGIADAPLQARLDALRAGCAPARSGAQTGVASAAPQPSLTAAAEQAVLMARERAVAREEAEAAQRAELAQAVARRVAAAVREQPTNTAPPNASSGLAGVACYSSGSETSD